MPGRSINQQWVNLYMPYCKDPKHSQVNAAAKAAFPERAASRIDSGEHQAKPKIRHYRTRKDPFSGLCEEHLIPLQVTEEETWQYLSDKAIREVSELAQNLPEWCELETNHRVENKLK